MLDHRFDLIENFTRSVNCALAAGYNEDEIIAAVEYIINTPELRNIGAEFTNPYVDDCL